MSNSRTHGGGPAQARKPLPAGGLLLNHARYDGNGNVSQRTDPNGRQITFTYDNLDRLTRKTYSDGTAQVDYTFDDAAVANSKGRLTKSLVAGGVERAILGYDSLGRVISSRQKHGAVEYPFTYTYNALNQPVTIQYPSERTYRYSYNPSDATRLSQVDRVTSPANQTVEKTYAFITQYSPVGAPQLVQLGSAPALYQHTRYNSRLQLTNAKVGTGITYTDTAASDRMALALSYGTSANNGNVLAQVTALPGAAFSQTYNYDQVNRLCSVREQATATPLAAYSCTGSGALEAGESWRQTFGNDRFGNQWVAQHLGANMPYSGLRPTTQSNFDANTNRLVESAGQVGYDATGNQTTHGGWTLAFDAEGRIKTATPSSGNAAAYEYDGEGHRVKKTVGSVATWFVYDVSGQLAAEYTAAGPTGSAETHYLTTDHLGSTRLVTRQDGTVMSRHDYLPFGEEIPNNLGGRTAGMGYVANPAVTQRFTGKERDSETGLDYFGARYLSGVLGRWTSADWSETPQPVPYANFASPQTLNLYGYTLNNPLRFADPDGHAQIDIRYTKIGPGYTHAYLVVTDTNGSRTYFRAGPTAGGPPSGAFGALSSASGGSASQSSGSGSSAPNSSNSSSPGSGPGGHGANAGPFGQLSANSGAYVPGTVDYEAIPSASDTLLSNDQPAAGYIRQLQRYEAALNEAGIPYNPLSTNSNAYATGAARSLGLTVPTPSAWAPGRDTKLVVTPPPPPPRPPRPPSCSVPGTGGACQN